MKKIPIACLVILLIAASCKKPKTELTELEKLPPITQTGAKTFGCLVNGKAWTPYGQQNVVRPNFYCTYDPALNGGNLGITAQQFDNLGNDVATFALGVDSVQQTGAIQFSKNRVRLLFVSSVLIPNCDFNSTNANTYGSGSINISRFDMAVGIISGTFAFKCKKDGCDTLNITDGRFDWKF